MFEHLCPSLNLSPSQEERNSDVIVALNPESLFWSGIVAPQEGHGLKG